MTGQSGGPDGNTIEIDYETNSGELKGYVDYFKSYITLFFFPNSSIPAMPIFLKLS